MDKNSEEYLMTEKFLKLYKNDTGNKVRPLKLPSHYLLHALEHSKRDSCLCLRLSLIGHQLKGSDLNYD